MAGPAGEVLEVLPARVVVQPLHVDAVAARRPGPRPRRRAALPLAPAELDAEAGAVEVVPALRPPGSRPARGRPRYLRCEPDCLRIFDIALPVIKLYL